MLIIKIFYKNYILGSAKNHIKSEIAHNFGFHQIDDMDQMNDVMHPVPRIGIKYTKWFKEPGYVDDGT